MASSVHSSGSNTIAVKGHLVTKSSALSTNSSKLEAQFITAQHMASHYKRVINAKSAINTLPPKSITCSQKARDRARREMNNYSIARQSVNRTRSADASLRNSISVTDNSTAKTTSLMKPKSASPGMKSIVYRDTINRNIIVQEVAEPKPLPDQQKLNKSMSNIMASFTKIKQSTGTFAPSSIGLNTSTVPANMFSKKFEPTNNIGHGFSGTQAPFLFATKTGNANTSVMDSYESPALKAMSRLVAGRHYDVLENHAEKFTHPAKTFQPRIKNTNTSSNLAQKSSYYQPPRRRRKNTNDSRPGSVVGSSVSIRPESNKEKPFLEKDGENEMSDFEVEDVNVSQNQANVGSSSRKSSFRKSSVDNQQLLKTDAQKDLELKYLEFIKEVTNDVIARGISSTRVINTCFEYHLNKNKDTLDHQKMLQILETLRADIGISSDNAKSEPNKKYLTLEKLGYSTSPDNSKRRDSPASAHEDQIVKNIESIRRRSISSKSSSASSNNNKENSQPVSARKIDRSSEGSEPSQRKSSSADLTETKQKASILKKASFSEAQNQVVYNSDDDDDDDDDVFTGSNFNRGLATISKVDPDDIFNDDYGEESEDGEEGELKATLKQDKNEDDNDEEDDDDDDFDSMLKTKTFSNSRSKLASATNKSIFDDESNRISRETARATTPRPVPRKPFIQDNVSGGSFEASDDDAY